MSPIEFNALGGDLKMNSNGTVSGYVVVWDVEDLKGDVHRKGAYKNTIANDRNVPLLPNHDQSNPIGRAFNFVEDDFGLKFEANFASTDRAQEYRQFLQEGVIEKFSMGWAVLKSNPRSGGGREILEVKLFEVSPVAVPVGEATMVLEVNNIAVEPVPDIMDRFYGLVKNIGDKKMKLENQAELLKLAEAYKSVIQPGDPTEPTQTVVEEVSEDEYLMELNKVLKQKLKV